jgi:triacylglycerol lipase
MSTNVSPDHMDKVLRFLDERPDPDWNWDFDESATGESPKNALALGNLALLAYSGEDDMERFLINWGFKGGFRFLIAGDTVGFVARMTDSDTSSVFISYRGTEPTMIPEWLSDIHYQQADLTGFPGKIHGGFGQAFSSVMLQTQRALTDLPGARHYFTGHSLGGAITVLAAATFRNQVTAVSTYGQPRVGDRTFSDAYDAILGEVTFRHVNNYDIVPHVPPERLPAPLPPLPGDLLDVRQDLADVVSGVDTIVTGELFTHVGQLRLFIDGTPEANAITGQTVSQKVTDFNDHDPFVLHPPDLRDPLRGIRDRVNLALNGDRGIIDHDPAHGYLPRLRQQAGLVPR